MALNTYASELDGVLNQAAGLAQQQDAADSSLNAAQSRENAAATNLRSARDAVWAATDPATRAQAEYWVSGAATALAAATASRESAAATVTQLQNQAQGLRGELQGYASRCASQLQDASSAGIQNSIFSWADRNIVDGVPGVIVGDVAGTIGNFAAKSWGVMEAAVQFELSPTLGNLDHLAKAYSEWVDAAKPILTALAVIAVAVLLVVPGADIAVAAAGFLALAPWLSKGLDASKLGDDTYLYFRGEGSGKSLVNDSIDLGTDFLPGPSAHAEESNLASSLDTYSRTGTSQARGWITQRIEALAPAESVATGFGIVVGAGANVVKAVCPAVVRDVHALLGQVIVPAPSPISGPFPSITQGPTARVRTTVARRAAPVGAAA